MKLPQPAFHQAGIQFLCTFWRRIQKTNIRYEHWWTRSTCVVRLEGQSVCCWELLGATRCYWELLGAAGSVLQAPSSNSHTHHIGETLVQKLNFSPFQTSCWTLFVSSHLHLVQPGRGCLTFGEHNRNPQPFRRASVCKLSRQKLCFWQLRKNEYFLAVKLSESRVSESSPKASCATMMKKQDGCGTFYNLLYV